MPNFENRLMNNVGSSTLSRTEQNFLMNDGYYYIFYYGSSTEQIQSNFSTIRLMMLSDGQLCWFLISRNVGAHGDKTFQ